MIFSGCSRFLPACKLVPSSASAALIGVLVIFMLAESFFGWPILGWTYRLGQGAGNYGSSFGLSILVAGNLLIFLIMIWHMTQVPHKVNINNEQRKMEAALRQSRNGLEVEVMERTEELRQSEMFKLSVLDALPQHLAVLDQTGTIIEVNQAWQRFALDNEGAGLGSQIGVGANYLAACRKGTVPDLAEAQQAVKGIELVLAGEIPIFTLEYTCHSTTEQHWFRLTAVPLSSESGGAVVSHINVTERRQLYEAEQKARIRAEEASRMKDEFLAVVSHELRSPLNAILGWVNLLRGGKLKPEIASRALETIENSARIQNHLVSDLIDVSRIITGKLQLNVSLVKPAHFIEAAIETVRLAAAAKEIQIQTVIDEDIISLSGDADRLQQIVWNLVSNAIRFTPRGGQLQVRLERVNANVKIIVSDNGSGIKAEFLPFVFDRFSQQDTSSTRKIGGLGMGLAIVRHLVELHGGSVQVESAGEGQGATFTVKLPLAQQIESESEKETLTTYTNMVELSPVPQLSGIRVLVVDDEEMARELVVTILAQAGAETLTAASVMEAMTTLAGLLPEQYPDVVISDLSMPDEDGYSLIRQLRQLAPERGGRLPAIALTAFGRMEDRVRVLGAGFQAHLTKPVEAEELIAVIASLITRYSGQSGVPQTKSLANSIAGNVSAT